MGATSVTGVGSGCSSSHYTLGVNKLIGPRWDEAKERTFRRNNGLLYGLICTQTLSLIMLIYLLWR